MTGHQTGDSRKRAAEVASGPTPHETPEAEASWSLTATERELLHAASARWFGVSQEYADLCIDEAVEQILAARNADPFECTCPYTDPSTWISAAACGYGSGYEPGSMQEWNPDCPVHPGTKADPARDAELRAGLTKADVALARWEGSGPTSLTVALCVEALYDLRAALTEAEARRRRVEAVLEDVPLLDDWARRYLRDDHGNAKWHLVISEYRSRLRAALTEAGGES